MGPETGSKGALAVALCIETFLEEFLGKEACLWKSVHAASDFDIDVSVGIGFSGETILCDKVRWQATELELHVFVARHRRVEVEILDTNRHEPCTGRGDDTVKEKLDGEKVNSGRTAIAGVVDSVAADGETCTAWISFLGR